MSVVRRRVAFRGHVQGVGLRGTLSKYCMRHHVTGWMSNSPDPGLVCAELQGDEAAIAKVLRSVESFFSDPARCRGMRVELVGEADVTDVDPEMREVAWSDLPRPSDAECEAALPDAWQTGSPGDDCGTRE